MSIVAMFSLPVVRTSRRRISLVLVALLSLTSVLLAVSSAVQSQASTTVEFASGALGSSRAVAPRFLRLDFDSLVSAERTIFSSQRDRR